MKIRQVFSPRQMTEIHNLYAKYTGYFESGKAKQFGPQFDFPRLRNTAMYAYLLDDRPRAARFLRQAVEFGFPPDWKFEVQDDRDRQWKNYQDGTCALGVALAAQILGLKERRDAILAWTVGRLLDTEIFTQDEDPQYSTVTFNRAYALLAAGRYWPKMEADLTLADRQLREATDNPCSWSLPKALTALVRCQKGNVSRRQATASLVQFILDSKGHVFDRVEACFHVLYLQSAFPDVFDPILPPFPVDEGG